MFCFQWLTHSNWIDSGSILDSWNTVTAIILLNILISLFSSAYAEVIDNAEAQYLAFFASKTIAMIRAPDSYVYPAPFNLIETIFIVPFEWVLGLVLMDTAQMF